MKAIFSSFTSYVFGVLLFAVICFFLANQFPLLRYFFEKEAPHIRIDSAIEGFGTGAQELRFTVEDPKSGIELIRVRVDQSRLNKELVSLSLPLNTFSKEVSLSIDGQAQGFKPGNVRVTIEAYDRSLDSNGAKLSIDVPVRFDKPEIEVITSQHNAVQGGMELVFYRIKADTVKQTGVRIRNKEYVGFPAHVLDSEFETIKGLYFSFFVIPTDFSSSDSAPHVYARNSVGNEAQHTFYYKVQNVKKRSWQYFVSDISKTRFDNTTLESFLSGLTFTDQRYWKDSLSKAMGSLMSPLIGDTLRITDSQGAERKIKNELMSFRYPYNKDILSTGEGKVLSFADGKGYGNIVVIDHGFGLLSVFSNLDEVLVRKNEVVKSNDSIGKAAQLPQSKESGFEYGLFYQGVPTRAIEWWDDGWVRDHVIKKISDVKERLGLDAPAEVSQVMNTDVIQPETSANLPPVATGKGDGLYVDDERGRDF